MYTRGAGFSSNSSAVFGIIIFYHFPAVKKKFYPGKATTCKIFHLPPFTCSISEMVVKWS
jgi:hypothetical protein